jgi:hypothetical protein
MLSNCCETCSAAACTVGLPAQNVLYMLAETYKPNMALSPAEGTKTNKKKHNCLRNPRVMGLYCHRPASAYTK